MSEDQRSLYQNYFPFLDDSKSIILSSVFDMKDLEYIENLKKSRAEIKPNGKCAIIGSNSWIKGTEQTKAYLEERQIDYN